MTAQLAFCFALTSLVAANAAEAHTRTSSAAAHRYFTFDPVMDGAVITAGAGFALLLELIVRTGELRPQEPVDPSVLLFIDRGTATGDHNEASAAISSNIGLGVVAAYTLADIVLAEPLDRGDAWVYAVLYAETAAVNLALTNLVKIAVRRPRPAAYADVAAGKPVGDTDKALSFYSGHTSMTSALTATAVYLSFERGDPAWQSWLILGVGVATTSFVAVQRIRARAHFATDVIAGALAGAGVGVVVPHLHRIGQSPKIRPTLGAWSDGDGAGGLAVSGRF